jgi:hypothetical protein
MKPSLVTTPAVPTFATASRAALLATKSFCSLRTTGPFNISVAHVNGTITAERTSGIFERFNTCRIKPHHAHTWFFSTASFLKSTVIGPSWERAERSILAHAFTPLLHTFHI